MIYAKVDETGQKQLKAEMKETKDKKWYQRLKIIDLSAQGYRVTVLSDLFDLSEHTIRTYIHNYNEDGLVGLNPNYGKGRPLLLDWTKNQWLDLLHQPPANHEQLKSGAINWTQELLQQYFALYHHLTISRSTLSKAIKRAGLRWRRAKLTVKSPDPLYLVKRQRVEQLKQKASDGTLSSQDAEEPPPIAKKRAYLVYFDSTDLHWCPDIGTNYNAIGTQTKVPSPGRENPWYALFGSLIFPSGEGLYTIHHYKRHEEVQSHLQLLIDFDPDAFWFVVLDNASAHTTNKLHPFLQQTKHSLELVALPTYSPHLNLIERLWSFMRGQITRNHFFESLDDQAQAVVYWLHQVPFSRFCSLMGLDFSHP